MTQRFVVRHQGRPLASVTAKSAEEACQLARRLVSNPPELADCTASVPNSDVQQASAAEPWTNPLERILEDTSPSLRVDDSLMVGCPIDVAKEIRIAIATGLPIPIRAVCYQPGAATGLPGVIWEDRHPSGTGLIAVQDIGTLYPNDGDWLFLDGQGRPSKVVTAEEFRRR